MGSLIWASNREYADLQRTYAYIAGILGVGVAFLLLLVRPASLSANTVTTTADHPEQYVGAVERR